MSQPTKPKIEDSSTIIPGPTKGQKREKVRISMFYW